MANEKQDENVVVMPEQSEARDLTVAQRNNVVALQNQIQTIVNQRNQYIHGVADGLELDDKWVFDFDGFLNGRTCRFLKPVADKK
jgi:hypothetical protein